MRKFSHFSLKFPRNFANFYKNMELKLLENCNLCTRNPQANFLVLNLSNPLIPLIFTKISLNNASIIKNLTTKITMKLSWSKSFRVIKLIRKFQDRTTPTELCYWGFLYFSDISNFPKWKIIWTLYCQNKAFVVNVATIYIQPLYFYWMTFSVLASLILLIALLL